MLGICWTIGRCLRVVSSEMLEVVGTWSFFVGVTVSMYYDGVGTECY